ncbi:MAG: hypothetical protein ACE5GN_06000, partial [Waddliaceae bacterium]
MMGMAKQLFVESEGYSPWQEKRASRWPLLEKGWKIGCFSYVDVAFAEMLLRDIPEATELTAVFLCHLSRATREGHICVRVEGGVVTPSPKELWFSEVTEGEINDLIRIAEQLAEGALGLPESLITGPICRQGNLYYFQKYWIMESLFIENFQRLLLSTPIPEIPFEKVDKEQLN